MIYIARCSAPSPTHVVYGIGLPADATWCRSCGHPRALRVRLDQHLLEVPGSEAAGWGFLSKNSSLSASALVYAIRAVAAGRTVLDPAIRAQREIRRNSPLTRLSRRQREVVALVADGVTNAAIADRLGISPRSVDAHLNAASGLLGIPARRERNPRGEAVRSYLQHTTSTWTSAG
ncbi:Oxygen regulatory protein NreC [Microbacterium laevaniformans]|uniref:Oxygen regulatory protein NreC n=1 Tax=Microbacterium laevaniformans TaxID=36807 RepID=A0A150HEQ0_9MICO|nr:Oxygen regulatory protein NreC [Microbacterium laevaniformans]